MFSDEPGIILSSVREPFAVRTGAGRVRIDELGISVYFWHGRVGGIDLTPHRDAWAGHGVAIESVALARLAKVRLNAEETTT